MASGSQVEGTIGKRQMISVTDKIVDENNCCALPFSFGIILAVILIASSNY